MLSELRSRIIALAKEVAKNQPGVDEDVLVIRLQRTIYRYFFERMKLPVSTEERQRVYAVDAILKALPDDPLEPTMERLPTESLTGRAIALVKEICRRAPASTDPLPDVEPKQ